MPWLRHRRCKKRVSLVAGRGLGVTHLPRDVAAVVGETDNAAWSVVWSAGGRS